MMTVFEKGLGIRHIGHLDLMRTMQRALRRSGLPLQYSKGFSPHIQLSFAYPLSVGVAGLREVMDVPLAQPVEEAEYTDRLNRHLPGSIRVRRARALDDGFPTLMALVAGSRYAVYLQPGPVGEQVAACVPQWMALPSFQALRKTKSGEALCDVRPFVKELQAKAGPEGPWLSCLVENTREGTLKPSLLVKCLCQQGKVEVPPFVAVREEILCRDAQGGFVTMEDYSDGF